MKPINLILFLVLGLAADGCHPSEPDVMPMNFSMEINGVRYQQSVVAEKPNKQLLLALSNNDSFSCGFDIVWLTLTKPVFDGALLAVYLSIPTLVKSYPLTSYFPYEVPCRQADSLRVYVNIEEQPEVARPIDITSIAVYDLAKDPANYLEVTHFDAEKRQLRGRFHIKVVRSGVNKHIPIPLSDTLVLSNGEFSVGFSRKTS
ncbi:hypothetical protein [Persicitalea jodogahamensis]|uniref:NigD-like C-terminal beta sandwich domain-containing protein n=1 Tax=Persicitalea jodogahamensis TaxID=402147 RepID=A0A8J3D0Z8_9BACT|nr:hypothetical protein [Persicitalea jodogahamensis]GHB52362.1 hypothetical protein GCM10007390_01250 [Persicitalea jodogahamensis]